MEFDNGYFFPFLGKSCKIAQEICNPYTLFSSSYEFCSLFARFEAVFFSPLKQAIERRQHEKDENDNV